MVGEILEKMKNYFSHRQLTENQEKRKLSGGFLFLKERKTEKPKGGKEKGGELTNETVVASRQGPFNVFVVCMCKHFDFVNLKGSMERHTPKTKKWMSPTPFTTTTLLVVLYQSTFPASRGL